MSATGIVVDTSAVVAILADEPEAASLADAIAAARFRLMSVANMLEATIVLRSRSGEAGVMELERLLERAQIEATSVDAAQLELARDAHRRFGKGRHPARLNFGDCFAYALARHRALPLLFKGDDFVLTDVERVV